MIRKLMTTRRFIAAGVLSAFMFVGIASVNAQNISDGLIAYWPFDGDLQDAVGDSHGEGMGSDDIAYGSGKFGQGIDLDGVDQFVETPVENEEMFDFQDGTGFSISAWYKVGEFTKSWQALIAKGEGNRWRIHRRGGENILTGNGGNGDVPAGTPDINDGELHHIVLVSDPENDEVRLYSDGELSSTGNAPAIQSNDNPMMIGENPDARNRTWSGIIDDVGIWNRPLTEDEIAFLFGNSIASGLGTQMKVGLNFGVDQGDSSIDAAVAAGLVPQANWNNLSGGSGDASDIVADDGGASVATGISVEWVSNNSWSSTGGGEENNEFEDGGDRVIFTGYLDTGAATTTTVAITGIPQELQDAGYSVICYLMGGVPEKGGGYWVEDDAGNVLTEVLFGDSDVGTSEYIKDPGVDHADMGNYVILKGLSAANIVVKASTADGLGWAAAGRGALRAPLNAVQLVPESSGRRVVGQFSADWTDDEEPEGTYMAGVTEVGDGFLHITDAVNGANGAFTIEDFSNGAVFTDFEMSFRLHMSDSTCCGGADDTTAAHRPADGLSINIGNDLPDTIGLAEEGSGSGIRICFDTWDSGGGEAPAIDVWRGTEGEVGDGNQDGWTGGMLVRQKFNGVTSATEEEKFKDANGDYVWMWTQGEWVDVKISVMDGVLSINYKGHQVIKHNLPAAWAPLSGPNWLFAARTGGANETHWIDDLSITLYATTTPGVSLFEANAGGFEAQITDIEEAGVDADTIQVTFDGEVVETSPSKADGVTSFSYASAALLAAGSDHTLNVKYTDTNGKAQLLNLDFTVNDYTLIDGGSLADASLKGESGFLVYPTQISSGQGVGSIHGSVLLGAEKQINGGFIDPDTEEQYLNEADIDSFEGWSYYPEIVQVVNQNQDAPAGTGSFQANDKGNSTDREDEPMTGIPGWGDSTDGIASEYIALLDLAKGAYKLGVNSDDGFSATIGANFGDLLAQQIGVGTGTTNFEIYVAESGLYPLRVLYWEGVGGAGIEIYSFVNGEKTLINDPEVDGSIKAYTIKGATVDESTLDRATTGRAKMISMSPNAGDKLVKSGSIEVVIQNENTSVKQDTVVLTLNGEAVGASVSKNGNLVTISYAPDGGLPVGLYTVGISFEESNGVARGTEWSFNVPGIYKRDGDVPTEAQGGLTVREYHGIGTTDLPALFAAEKFPDSPDLTAIATYFEWPQSGDINVNPPGDVRNNYGWHLMGYIHPPETGEYIFAVATDDNSQLWLSTDSDPANAVQLTQESTWVGIRSYQPSGDETTSAPVFLEAGKVYFIECFAKEGGGGDNMAVAWSTPEDGPTDVDAGALPISGEFLSPFTWTGPATPELGSVSPSGVTSSTDYTVSVTINNGQNVKVTSFTALDIDGKSALGDSETGGSGISTKISVDGSADPATEVSVLVAWENSDGSTGSTSWNFMTAPHSENSLYIEVEDFNYDGGEWMTFEETAGGGAYDGLEFVADIDIHNNGNANPNYRFSEDNHPGMADSTGFDGNRGDFDMDMDFKMGWNDAGDWYNYTRDFPAKETYYNVIGRFSSGGAAIDNKLSIVTSDPSEPDQTLQDVGVFQPGVATACWDCFEFFPMTDADGNLAAVKIGGETTVRLSIVGGNSDLNYLVFVPSAIQEYPPSIVSRSPQGIYLDGSSVDLTVVLTKREAALADAQLSLNGVDIATDVATDGDTITLTGSGTLTGGDNTATVSFNGASNDWTISTGTPATGDVYALGTKAPATAAGSINAREYLGVGGVTIPELTGNANFPDSPDIEAYAGYFEWPQSGDINTKPAGNVKDNYGVQLIGFIHPSETADYTFVIAADDGAELWLSTDEDPANRQLLAVEPQWNGVRAFAGGDRRFVVAAGTDRERFSNVSAPISLEAGKAYFIEALMNEGGGGDNLAVAWTTGDPVANDALPISGDHLSPWITPPAPVDNGDGTITFDGHLAWEWWDGIGGAHPMEALTDNARYPDSPDGATFAPSWNTRTALAGGFDGDGRENYGGRMSGVLTAPESGTYRFFIASDDHGLLRISTDADPANAVRVAEQTGCCNNFTLDDGGLSGTVDLVAGNQYYMESLLKEGGGGDWMTVAWRMPSEDIDSVPGGNQDGISGKYFTGTVTVPALPALSSSLSPGNDAVDVNPDASITLNISEGATTLAADSVSISLNGTQLVHTATEGSWSRSFSIVTQEGKTHSITAPTGKLGGGSQNAITVTFTDSAGTVTTIESSFRVKSYHIVDMAAAGTVKYIEAEDFDFDGGSHKTFAEVGAGGSYDGLGVVLEVDIHNAGNSSPNYRDIPDHHPGMADSSWDSGRNGFNMEVDFKMGWNDAGDWYNYTRDFPEGGTYAVFGRFSSGGSPVAVDLSVVTEGQGTEDQTLESLGTFTGPATGGWNTMKFFPLNDADGELAVVSLSGTSTVRLTILPGNVDMNYLAFVPYEQAVLFSADPSTVKYIEAEDFDFDGGSFKTFEEVGLGGSYDGLGVVLEVDIHNAGNSSPNYRDIPDHHPGMADSSWDAERGGGNGFSMEVDFKMGWNDAGDWYNYTRDFPEDGSYAVYGRFSSGGSPVAVDLSLVTAGHGTEDQTLESLGTFTGPATGGWNTMQFFPLKDEDGNLATVELSGQSTVRLTILPGNVDMNYLAFVPYAAAAGGGDAPALSVVNNGDGTVTVTFEGKLQAAPTVNGPWQDSGLTSPATIPADQAQQYARAVSD